MDDPTDIRLPRLAPLLLVGVLVGLAIFRPGNLAGDDPAYRLFTGLTAVAAVGYAAWRFHGLIPAAAVIALLGFADSGSLGDTAYLERGPDAVLLATLALGIGVGSRQGRPGWAAWAVLAVLAAGISYFGWFGRELPAPADPVARYRVQHITMALAAVTVAVGLMARGASWRDRARLVAVAVLIPAAGVAATRPDRDAWLQMANGGEWHALADEWRGAFANGHWADGAWCWTWQAVVLPLLALGLWRTLARGRNGRKKGRPPLAWLIAGVGLGTILAVGARPAASGSLALAAGTALLSVFGVADLILALVERIELKPPEPGPAPVPRVR